MSIWTSADLDAMDKAIALGAKRVRYPDGRELQYRDLSEMNLIRNQMATAINGGIDVTPRVTFAEFSRD